MGVGFLESLAQTDYTILYYTILLEVREPRADAAVDLVPVQGVRDELDPLVFVVVAIRVSVAVIICEQRVVNHGLDDRLHALLLENCDVCRCALLVHIVGIAILLKA